VGWATISKIQVLSEKCDFIILTILSAILLKDYSNLYTANSTGFDFN
jgi:hypothetical protein